jgi:transposase
MVPKGLNFKAIAGALVGAAAFPWPGWQIVTLLCQHRDRPRHRAVDPRDDYADAYNNRGVAYRARASSNAPLRTTTKPSAPRSALGSAPTKPTHRRYRRWCKSGVFARIFETLAADADNEFMMIDATIVRAHQHSAGAQKKTATIKPSAVPAAA